VGGEQINKALQQLEKVIQQNASASEEMAATTEELTGQSDQLVSALAFFRTGDEVYALGRRPGTVKKTERAATAKKNSHVAANETETAALAGVNIRLKEKHADLDSEFERY
jgi:methyl-accepting chemotaxis protein